MEVKIIKEVCLDNKKVAKYCLKHQDEFDRFETCSNLDQGGLTPSIKLFKFINKKMPSKDQVVMIRNKNIFTIDDQNDIEILKNQIREFLKVGAKHFIFGYITKEKTIDEETLMELILEVKKEPNTTWSFHMAIDLIDNYDSEINKLIKLGFCRILTKGGNDSALNNIEQIKYLVSNYSDQIEILIGGKVTKENYLEIHNKTNANQFHGTKII